MTACPKSNLFSKLLAVCLRGIYILRKQGYRHRVLSSKSKKAYFISLMNWPCFLYKFKMNKTSWVCRILTQVISTAHFWGSTTKFCQAKAVHFVKFRRQTHHRYFSAFNLITFQRLKKHQHTFCLSFVVLSRLFVRVGWKSILFPCCYFEKRQCDLLTCF